MNYWEFLSNVDHAPLTAKSLLTLVMVVLLIPLYHLAKGFIARHVSDPDVRQRYWSFLRSFTFFLGVVLVAGVWLEELKTVSLLLTGLVAAFLLTNKEIVMGLAGRVSLGVTGQYTIGDRIMINNVAGDVINVGLLYTVVFELRGQDGERQSNGRVVWIPHMWLLQYPISNFTHMHDYIWEELELTFPLETSREQVSEVITDEASRLLEEEIHHAQSAVNALGEAYAVRLPPLSPVVYMSIGRHTNGMQYLIMMLRYSVRARMVRPVKNRLLMGLLTRLEMEGLPLWGSHNKERPDLNAHD